MEKEKQKELGERIKKLLALGMKHEDTPEGQSALEKAKTLMKKYGIRFSDIEEDGTVDGENVVQELVKWHKSSNDFEMHLANTIALALDCTYLCGAGRSQHIFIGTKGDMEIATWLFKYVRIQIYRMAEKTSYKGKELRTYFYGAYTTLVPRINDIYSDATPENMSEEQCRDLIVVKNDAVERKRNELYPNTKTARKTKKLSGSMDAFVKGQMAGEKVNLNRQLKN